MKLLWMRFVKVSDVAYSSKLDLLIQITIHLEYFYLFPCSFIDGPIICHYLSLYYSCHQLDEEDFKEEQNSVARLIHMLYNEDPEEMLKVITAGCW